MTPLSTYRVPAGTDLDPSAVRDLAGYLARLGVTHLSTAVPAGGGERFAHGLRDAGLGLVVDLTADGSPPGDASGLAESSRPGTGDAPAGGGAAGDAGSPAPTDDDPPGWCAAEWVDGLRVTGIDRLADPGGYLRRLHDLAPQAWLVVAKNLARGERLADWPVAGTTGSDVAGQVGGLFVDPTGEAPLTAVAPAPPWPQEAVTARREVIAGALAGERDALTRLAGDVPDAAIALAELAAHFPVQRGYLPDTAPLDWALRETYAHRPDLGGPLVVLVPRLRDPDDPLAVRFQQFTAAVGALGVDGTARYRWTRFVARNEPGTAPDRFGVGVEEFHAAAADRHRRWPRAMTALTGDGGVLGEDARARLAVLAEMPDRWLMALSRWSTAAPLTDLAFSRLLWQTVVGAWPVDRERLRAHVVAAARRAGTHTTAGHPDEGYEDGLHKVVDAIYDDADLHADVDRFVGLIDPDGRSNALGQKLLQLTMPGVPEVYQGSEVWDLSLGDPGRAAAPDPAEIAGRRELLERIDGGQLPPVDGSGAAKLLVVSRVLRLRREAPQRFCGYSARPARGPAAGHVVAFDRGGVIAVATRLPLRLREAGGWADTVLPLGEGSWTDVLTGTETNSAAPALAELMAHYPVALLLRSAADAG